MWFVFRDACAEIRSLIDMGAYVVLKVTVPTRSSFKVLISRGLFQEAKKVLWSGYFAAMALWKGYCNSSVWVRTTGLWTQTNLDAPFRNQVSFIEDYYPLAYQATSRGAGSSGRGGKAAFFGR